MKQINFGGSGMKGELMSHLTNPLHRHEQAFVSINLRDFIFINYFIAAQLEDEKN